MSARKALLNESDRVTKRHLVILFMSWAGWLFDFYDLMLFSFLLAPIKRDLGLKDWELSLLMGSSLAATALGGIIFGFLADRFGRKTHPELDHHHLLGGGVLLRLFHLPLVAPGLQDRDGARCGGRVGHGADPHRRDLPRQGCGPASRRSCRRGPPWASPWLPSSGASWSPLS